MSAGEFPNIARAEFVQFFVVTKYYDCNIHRAKHGKLMSLLEQSTFTL